MNSKISSQSKLQRAPRASRDVISLVSRRQLGLSGLTIIASPLILSNANALILDEDDEELIEKAKANRAQRIQAQKATTRSFLTSEGLKDIAGEKDLIPVQRGINRLAQSGAQIEGGDIQAASITLSDGWAKEFDAAVTKLGGSDAVSSKLSALQSAAGKNDAIASKKAYVALVTELQSWQQSVGVSDRIRGIN